MQWHDPLCRAFFHWAAAEQRIPASVWERLVAVESLKICQTAAPRPPVVRMVPWESVEATLPQLTPLLADMVRFQLLTGCRPGEVCDLRPWLVDRQWGVVDGVPVRLYCYRSTRPPDGGKHRSIPLGPPSPATNSSTPGWRATNSSRGRR
jgi:hypothetical protein